MNNELHKRAARHAKVFARLTGLAMRLVEEHAEVAERVAVAKETGNMEAHRLATQDLRLVLEHQRRVDKRINYYMQRIDEDITQLHKLRKPSAVAVAH